MPQQVVSYQGLHTKYEGKFLFIISNFAQASATFALNYLFINNGNPITHMGDGGSVADFFSAPGSQVRGGPSKNLPQNAPSPMCVSENMAYIAK